MRPLHWVIKSTDLARTLSFYAATLGFKVLRHEEFLEGCEATCNGKFGGAWSKTMIGKDSETTGFCLEVIFNYGVREYRPRGNAFGKLKVRDGVDGERWKAAKEWWKKQDDVGVSALLGEDRMVKDPDDNVLEFVQIRADDVDEDIVAVSLNVTNVRRSMEFYGRAFLASVMRDDGSNVMIRFGPKGTAVELVEVKQEIIQGEAQGRFATETDDGEPDALSKRVGEAHVIHG